MLTIYLWVFVFFNLGFCDNIARFSKQISLPRARASSKSVSNSEFAGFFLGRNRESGSACSSIVGVECIPSDLDVLNFPQNEWFSQNFVEQVSVQKVKDRFVALTLSSTKIWESKQWINLSFNNSGYKTASVGGFILFFDGVRTPQYWSKDWNIFVYSNINSSLLPSLFGDSAISLILVVKDQFVLINSNSYIHRWDSLSDTWTRFQLQRNPLYSASVGNFGFFVTQGYLIIWDSTANLLFNFAKPSWNSQPFELYTVNKYIVLFNPPSNHSSLTIETWDSTQNLWNNITLSQSRTKMAVVAVGSYLYFAGGQDSQGLSNRVDIWDSSSGNWDSTTLSLARKSIVGVAIGTDNVLFAGGDTSLDENTLEASDRVDVICTNYDCLHYEMLLGISVGLGLVALILATVIIIFIVAKIRARTKVSPNLKATTIKVQAITPLSETKKGESMKEIIVHKVTASTTKQKSTTNQPVANEKSEKIKEAKKVKKTKDAPKMKLMNTHLYVRIGGGYIPFKEWAEKEYLPDTDFEKLEQEMTLQTNVNKQKTAFS
jgi:hypothetical protein